MGGGRKRKLKRATHFSYLSQIKIMTIKMIIIIIGVMSLILSLFSTCFDGDVKLKRATEFFKCIDVNFVL